MMINNNNLEQALDDAWHLINQRQVNKAQQACLQLVTQFPHNDDAWFAQSFLYFQLSNGIEALAAIEKSLQIAPSNVQWLTHKAHCYYLLTDTITAKETLDPVLKRFLNNSNSTSKLTPELLSELALVLNKLALHSQAEYFYAQAIECCLRAKNTPVHYLASLYFNLASIQRYLGKVALAVNNLDKALQLNPRDGEAQLLRSSLTKQSAEQNHVQQLQALLAQDQQQTKTMPVLAKTQCHFALAKELEDTKQYSQSFDALLCGATLRRRHMQYDVKQDIATLEKISQVFTRDLFDKKTFGHHNKRPIFILGLPRTGSTLVDRILSSHSEVTSAGELNDFAMQMMAQCESISAEPPKDRLALVELSAQLDFAKLGQAYSEQTQQYGKDNQYIIDKLPLNSLYVGLIHLALPEAKIIHIKRNPMDTCYAIFKQLFTQGYPFSYDLNELGQYFIAHDHMMTHWHNVLPDVIHQINYENLINNSLAESEKLLAYCQLDWQDNCLNFHQNNDASTTASASQVRQPIYTSSLEKWRHFEQELAPLQQQLSQAGLI